MFPAREIREGFLEEVMTMMWGWKEEGRCSRQEQHGQRRGGTEASAHPACAARNPRCFPTIFPPVIKQSAPTLSF